ncbi:hypothetical protein [Sebaldella sp. S0638]|uniref:hypothetical protein n=1 Tax=Sebaldella sp. S0638 TaxID=2957809 RepID=UPI00209F082A|nr:hypothetical protein [Sebaldella sp. S0638]MCP1225745.1 hypothetical protein [Sebaldella sp. S0638]
MRIMLIYPKYPLKNIVDPDWEEEYNAVSKMPFLETGLYDEYEKRLIFSKLYENENYIFLYRGWMLEPENHPSLIFPQYNWFSDHIQAKTANSGFFWTELLKPYIIGPTILYPNEFLDNLQEEKGTESRDVLGEILYSPAASELGNSIFVKDGVKSESEPVISSAEELSLLLSKMKNHIGKFRDGLIFKPAVKVENEKRFFCFAVNNNVSIFPSDNIQNEEKDFLNNIINTVIPAFNLNFFTLDTACVDGKTVLVELGHGEYSSLKNLSTEEFSETLEFIAEKI